MTYSFSGGRSLSDSYLQASESGALNAVDGARFRSVFGTEFGDGPEGAPFGFHFVQTVQLEEDSTTQTQWRGVKVDSFSGTERYGSAPGSIDPAVTVLLGILDEDLLFVWSPATGEGSVLALQDPPAGHAAGEAWAPHWVQIASTLDEFLDRLLA